MTNFLMQILGNNNLSQILRFIIIYYKFILMESLKALLAKKKQEVGSTKQVSNSQLQKERQQKFYQEKSIKEKQKQDSIVKKLVELDQFYQTKKKMKNQFNNSVQLPQAKLDESSQTPPLPKQQIIAKLRQLNQPITLFGEDQWSRYRRLRKCQVQGMKNKTNGILNDEQFKRKLREDEQYEQLDAKYRNRLIQPRLMDDLTYRNRKIKILEDDKLRDITLDQKCQQIMLWCRKVLKAWSQNLEHKYNTQQKKKSVEGKLAFSLFKDSSQHLEPFLKVLRARDGDKQMLNAIYIIMNAAVIREYVQANDKYIQLSIGNAPWPMGVTMLGITVKRNVQRLSHILNDEMCRKWTQTIKRLLTISQQLYPNEDTTKMVLYSVEKLI